MAQLYFKFGAMGSSKTANALMARFCLLYTSDAADD